MVFLGERLHGKLQCTVNSILHDHFGIPRLDMDVARSPLQSREDHGVHEANHGTHARVPREFLSRNVLVAVFFLADHLNRESLGGLVQHALRLFGTLQQVSDLRGGGNFDLQALAEKTRQLVGEL